MNFGEALKSLKQGDCVRLREWKRGTYLVLDKHDNLIFHDMEKELQLKGVDTHGLLSVNWELYREY